MPTVFVLSKLRPNASVKEYERWIKEWDYPNSRTKMKSIKSYYCYRVTGSLGEVQDISYVEHIEITNFEEYKSDLNSPFGKELISQWSKFIGESKILTAQVIE